MMAQLFIRADKRKLLITKQILNSKYEILNNI